MLFLGLDVGTTGVRAAIVGDDGATICQDATPMPPSRLQGAHLIQDPSDWWTALCRCLAKVSRQVRDYGFSMSEIGALAVCGTSGTLLLATKNLQPLTGGYMYNSTGFDGECRRIADIVPPSSILRSATSPLARLLHLQDEAMDGKPAYAFHQADWIAARLMGRGGIADENNVLKLGYDLVNNEWPTVWFEQLGVQQELLPKVVPVGQVIGTVSDRIAARIGLSQGTSVVAGTTDGNAAFMGTGASTPGSGVTSLGTTLVIKLLSENAVNSPQQGIYSHRIGGLWLAGGASNSGGGVLLEYFTPERMKELETRLTPDEDTGLDYYPLPGRGERFPESDPAMLPRLAPRPDDDGKFFQGMLEGMARIERAGYDALRELGATTLHSIRSTGGGSASQAWLKIRRRILGCSITVSEADAATGCALIARSGATSETDSAV